MKINPEEYSNQFLEQPRKKKNIKSSIKSIEEALLGRVIFMTPEYIHVHFENKDYHCSLKGTFKKELKQNKDRICPGDLVFFDPIGKVILGLQERKTYLTRQNPSQKYQEQILAANIDLLLITTSIIEPAINPYLIDLYLLTAKRLNLTPIILINKVDLLDDKKNIQEKELIKYLKIQYEKLGIPVILVSSATHVGFKELEKCMKDKASVFSGASGVGKSSLINALEKIDLKVAPISSKNLKGTHTTTSSKLLKLKSGGFCVDTPGVQSMGFKDVEPITIRNLFPELANCECQFANCLHQNEKGCQIKVAVEKKEVSPLRLDSYYRLLGELKSSR